METAKVDIQKLQLLNDRIAQCFDALNQVRLSVHGLSHSTAQAGLGQQGFGPQMGAQGLMGAQSIYQQNPYQQQNPYLSQQGIGQNPFTQGLGQTSPWANPLGLTHSTFGVPSPYAQQQSPFGQVPFGGMGAQTGIGALSQINPFTAQVGGIGQVPFGVSPLTNVNPFVNPYVGLSHTSPVDYEQYARPLWADPILAAKVAQTFPFVQLPISPVGI